VSTSKRLSVSSRTIDEWVRKRKIPYLQIRDRFYVYEFEAVLAALRKLYQVDARF
jgi:predicted site-specific integrase-resolvase